MRSIFALTLAAMGLLVAFGGAQEPQPPYAAPWPVDNSTAIFDTTCAGACTKAISDSITAFGRSGTQDADFRSVTIPAYTGEFTIDGQAGDDVRLYIRYTGNTAAYFSQDGVGVGLDLRYLSTSGGVGFYGAAPVTVQCALPYATPPNPVTSAQARAEYDLAVQNCFNQNGVNLYSTPAP